MWSEQKHSINQNSKVIKEIKAVKRYPMQCYC